MCDICILYAGNSFIFTGDVPWQLKSLAARHGVEIAYRDVSAGGATLTSSRANAIKEMQRIRFDYVVMQDQSRRPLNDIDGFLCDVRILSVAAKESGAMPVLYNPAWANIDGKPDEKLQNILTAAYKQAAHENDAILVNAGDAWVYAYNAIPNLSLYAEDMFHANDAGAFLTACVFAATLFDLRIDDISQNDNHYSDSNATLLAQAAWDFVQTTP
ncbi:MAG: SGNH/GDSL hydrolase family protein [Defluviitaleaceae bacterium]|nr:SGNH/GDSL hydrolase family protein [Defluviitaleaceae bacterium]